jgi:hypothetical protein
MTSGSIAAAATLIVASSSPAIAQHQRSGADEDRASFEQALADYMSLREAATRTVPPLAISADAASILSNVAARAAAIRAARASACMGDLFTQGAARLLRTVVLQMASRRAVPSTIWSAGLEDDADSPEHPAAVNATVDWSRASAMPADLLAALPRLPAGLEYRFVGADLALVDVDAGLIVDVLPDVLSRPYSMNSAGSHMCS